MKRLGLILAASVATMAVSAPASAAALLPNTTGSAINTMFDASTQGTLLGSFAVNAQAPSDATYNASYRAAVYRNTLGTIDFYYQVSVNSILAGDEINAITMFNFANVLINDVFASTADLDGAGGVFTAANNPNSDGPGGSSLGFTSTAERNSGSTVRINFGLNGLEAAGETSAIYILRTNATSAARGGTFTSQDGSTVTVTGFQAVPEPATWGMMLLGFGAMGTVLRRRKVSKLATA